MCVRVCRCVCVLIASGLLWVAARVSTRPMREPASIPLQDDRIAPPENGATASGLLAPPSILPCPIQPTNAVGKFQYNARPCHCAFGTIHPYDGRIAGALRTSRRSPAGGTGDRALVRTVPRACSFPRQGCFPKDRTSDPARTASFTGHGCVHGMIHRLLPHRLPPA